MIGIHLHKRDLVSALVQQTYHNASCIEAMVSAQSLYSVVSHNVKLHQGSSTKIVHQQRHLSRNSGIYRESQC